MNATERQAIRKKHVPCTCGACYDEGPECVWCAEMDWPCDVIKVLDALDEAHKQLKCKHIEYDTCKCDAPDCYTHDKKYMYCPKCKAKL